MLFVQTSFLAEQFPIFTLARNQRTSDRTSLVHFNTFKAGDIWGKNWNELERELNEYPPAPPLTCSTYVLKDINEYLRLEKYSNNIEENKEERRSCVENRFETE